MLYEVITTIVYGIDTLLFLMVDDLMSVGFHIFVISGIIAGYLVLLGNRITSYNVCYTKLLRFGLIVVFLLLAAQFEKWTLPIAVVLSVPFAVLGALLLTWVLGLQNDVYFQVGLVTLVGLSAKNVV